VVNSEVPKNCQAAFRVDSQQSKTNSTNNPHSTYPVNSSFLHEFVILSGFQKKKKKKNWVLDRLFSLHVPSKPLTLNLMETLDLSFRKGLVSLINESYRKMKRIKVVENFRSTNLVLFIFCTRFIHRSYRVCKKRA
jgi:hypothetical protein